MDKRTTVSRKVVSVKLLCENHRGPAQVDAILVNCLAERELRRRITYFT